VSVHPRHHDPQMAGLPKNTTLALGESCGAILPDYSTGVTATDNHPSSTTVAGYAPAIMQSPAPDTELSGPQRIAVTRSAKDAAGNVGTHTFYVDVQYDAPPQASGGGTHDFRRSSSLICNTTKRFLHKATLPTLPEALRPSRDSDCIVGKEELSPALYKHLGVERFEVTSIRACSHLRTVTAQSSWRPDNLKKEDFVLSRCEPPAATVRG